MRLSLPLLIAMRALSSPGRTSSEQRCQLSGDSRPDILMRSQLFARSIVGVFTAGLDESKQTSTNTFFVGPVKLGQHSTRQRLYSPTLDCLLVY
jgi:hypothetical protein